MPNYNLGEIQGCKFAEPMWAHVVTHSKSATKLHRCTEMNQRGSAFSLSDGDEVVAVYVSPLSITFDRYEQYKA